MTYKLETFSRFIEQFPKNSPQNTNLFNFLFLVHFIVLIVWGTFKVTWGFLTFAFSFSYWVVELKNKLSIKPTKGSVAISKFVMGNEEISVQLLNILPQINHNFKPLKSVIKIYIKKYLFVYDRNLWLKDEFKKISFQNEWSFLNEF